jgi:hypothetical protein
VYDGIGPGDDLMALAQVGEIHRQRRAVWSAVPDEVDVEDLVTMLAQVADHPASCLAAPSGHDDVHAVPPRFIPAVLDKPASSTRRSPWQR